MLAIPEEDLPGSSNGGKAKKHQRTDELSENSESLTDLKEFRNCQKM